MTNNYRVHYKRGDLEIEVESTEKDYVDQMLKKLVPQSRQSHRGKGTGKEVIKGNIERKGSQRKAKRSRIHRPM